MTENVSATAAGFAPAVAPLTILESDAAVLSLTLSTNAVPEDAPAGAVIGTVSRNANFGQPLTVTLISDTPSALTVPASVIIPAGQASATFGLTPVNDGLVGDTRRANVSASAPGFSAESVFVYVLNVNTVQLTLRLANSAVTKGAASPATIGTITCKPPPPTSQDISLTVVGSSLVTVPPVVTIPAGASSVASSPPAFAAVSS